MSYIRPSWEMKFVKGISKDYVFEATRGVKEGNKFKITGNYIEDYDSLTNEGLVEIFAEHFKSNNKLLDEYLLKKLAEKLNVTLRKKPLTIDQMIKSMVSRLKQKSKMIRSKHGGAIRRRKSRNE